MNLTLHAAAHFLRRGHVPIFFEMAGRLLCETCDIGTPRPPRRKAPLTIRQRAWVGIPVGLVLSLLVALPVSANEPIDAATNAYRAELGLPPVATSPTLDQLAEQRATETVSSFAHDFWWWGPSGCAGIGENLAYTTATDTDWPLRAWISSPPHDANLRGDWDQMGSAEIVVDGMRYAVQLFGRDCGGTTSAPAPVPAPTVSVSRTPDKPVLPDTAMDR